MVSLEGALLVDVTLVLVLGLLDEVGDVLVLVELGHLGQEHAHLRGRGLVEHNHVQSQSEYLAVHLVVVEEVLHHPGHESLEEGSLRPVEESLSHSFQTLDHQHLHLFQTQTRDELPQLLVLLVLLQVDRKVLLEQQSYFLLLFLLASQFVDV